METSIKHINMKKVFSGTPFGMYRTDGDHSGEAFREDVIIPALQSHQRIHIDITTRATHRNKDGKRVVYHVGMGSSFYMAAFALLISTYPITYLELRKRLKLVSDNDTDIVKTIWQATEQFERDNMNDKAMKMLAYPQKHYTALLSRQILLKAGQGF